MTDFIKAYRRSGDRSCLHDHYRQVGYQAIYSRPKPKWLRKFSIISKAMQIRNGDRVLDVGCAAQMLRPYIERCGGHYEGLDIAEGFQPDYVADAEAMNTVPNDRFDWAVLSDVLEHLPNPEAALRSALRVSRKMIMVVPNWYRLECIPFLPRKANDRHLVRMPPSGWLRLCRSAGWQVISLRGFYYVPSIAFYPVLPLRAIDRLLNNPLMRIVSDRIDRRLAERGIVRYLGQELIVLCQRPETRPADDLDSSSSQLAAKGAAL